MSQLFILIYYCNAITNEWNDKMQLRKTASKELNSINKKWKMNNMNTDWMTEFRFYVQLDTK